MNKNAIKKFAIDARKKLIASVTDKAGMLGITESGVSEPISKGTDFEVYKTAAGIEVTLNRKQCEQRRKLADQIKTRGFEAVVEEVAYTWFNRICAIRFMEVNDYLPSRARVLSSEKEGKNEPDLVTQAPDVDLDFTDAERNFIIDAKMNSKLDELFVMLFVKQCNKLNEVLPELFEKTSDYTEMLLRISYTNKDDIIRMLVDEVSEADFNISSTDEEGNVTGQVEIIGWLYQYYNTELKDDTFAKLKKNVKITKERIPAATQLFTPDWIVRYMVENSVGRLWIEHLRSLDASVDEKRAAENFGWKYYLPEAEQEESVNVQLAQIRTSYKDMTPEDILCIDPCMGSGHILVAMFDVLMDIYKSAGYSERDAALLIVDKNIHGLDIDARAYQLAYFAVMMKGRYYNRRFLRTGEEQPHPMLHAIEESNGVNKAHLQYFGEGLSDIEKNNALNQLNGLLGELKDAREYGSILDITSYDWNLLEAFASQYSVDGQFTLFTVGIDGTQELLQKLIAQGKVMAQKYDAVVTNPPYMALSNGNGKLNEYAKKKYSDSKTDLFAMFIEKSGLMTKKSAFFSLITQHSWMFLFSYEKLREKLEENELVNMIHLGTRAFDEIAGEVVQTTSFVFRKSKNKAYIGMYKRLVEGKGEQEKKQLFLEDSKENSFEKNMTKYSIIPGTPFAYWACDAVFDAFSNGKAVGEIAEVKRGMTTSDNNRFLRYWPEVNITEVCFDARSHEEALQSRARWFPYSKGGGYRKWYGYQEYLIDWENEGERVIGYAKTINKSFTRTIVNMDYYFRPSVVFSYITTGPFSMRWQNRGFLYDSGGPGMFADEKTRKQLIACMNSKAAQMILKIISPTINLQIADVVRLPFLYDIDKQDVIEEVVEKNIELSKLDWDSFEASWDFVNHPLVRKTSRVSFAFDEWSNECNSRFRLLKTNEEELNRIFIGIYGLQDELTPNVEDKDVTIRKADLQRDIKSFISYAVGCMFGRYSLDNEGLIYAGGDWDSSKYLSFIPDTDNVIPITDDEYFGDDIVGMFCNWLTIVYGQETLEENLDFIAKALGNKGDTSREVIRNYFLKDFITDHMKIYQKRPIYWLFDSGKENGFKALIYMHRYNQDTIGVARTDYLHKTQKAVEQAMARAEYTVENASSGTDKAKATKLITKYTKQLAEMKIYDEAMAHIANQRIGIDLDDGVKVNYEKFQGVEVAQEGKKTLKIDLLAKIK